MQARRQRFLAEMEATVPWDAFLELIAPVYHKPSAKGGRPPFPLEVMLRIHLLQQWFTLSDPLMEEMLIDTPCFRRFAGIDMIEDRIPDETTILNFRHLLEEHRIAEKILETVNQSLREKGVMLREGTILDATIINAPSSTKNKKGERDPEMHSVAKGKQWFFGMRSHIGVDAASGLVHSVVNTAANVHELNTAADRIHGEEHMIYGDSGHIGIEKREEFKDCEAEMRVAKRVTGYHEISRNECAVTLFALTPAIATNRICLIAENEIRLCPLCGPDQRFPKFQKPRCANGSRARGSAQGCP